MITDSELLAGGADVELSGGGTVFVRLLPIRDLPKYLACFEDEAASVELFCGKEKGWADTLTTKSFEDILAAGERLNLDPLARYAARVQTRREKLMPGLTERVMGRLLDSQLTAPGSGSKPV
jgi:hypothetical protein